MVLPEEMEDAAFDGDVDAVRAFLAQHPERVDDVGDDGNTMFQLAAMHRMDQPEGWSFEVMQLLVTAGANVDRRINPEHEGPTELHQACILSSPEVLEALIRLGADVALVTRGPAGDFPASQPISILFGGPDWRGFAERRGRTEGEQLRCMYWCMLCLLRGGHPLDFLHEGSLTSLEAVIEPLARGYEGDAPYLNDALELARAVRAAQSTSTSTRLTLWQKYCLAAPKDLLRLRSLVARGRARKKVRTRSKTPREIELLFARSFPNELFWRVMAFWNPRR